MEYTFTLKYQLADEDCDVDALVERLGEAACDDALVGIGQPGGLALEFTREAVDADEAVRSALADVRRAAPSARLRIPLMADSDSIPIADSIPCDGGHLARVS